MLRFGVGLAIAVAVLSGAVLSGLAAAAETPKSADKTQPAVAPPVPARKTAEPGPVAPPSDVWSAAEIAAAKVQCAAAIKGLNVLVSYEEPIKDGECGTPAPIRLVKLDNVTFTPAALINCGMLAPLHTWISKDLQPAARRQLGARITNIEVMSDYSCRTAFGRVGKKLSQHAYVDALDIRGFTTEKGGQVLVLESWGATNRDVAAAKARADKIVETAQATAIRAAAIRGAAKAAQAAQSEPKPATASGNSRLKQNQAGVDVVTAILPGGTKRQQVAARLGGPPEKAPVAGPPLQKPPVAGDQSIPPLSRAAVAALATPTNTPDARFLREAHTAACRIFGTTLGPEANEMHRNHFHVDMAERKIKKICD